MTDNIIIDVSTADHDNHITDYVVRRRPSSAVIVSKDQRLRSRMSPVAALDFFVWVDQARATDLK